MEISLAAARHLMLAAQGLHGRSENPPTKMDVLATIRRMHVLQIDTIHVVARSPYLVLWSRAGNYEPRWLDELLAEGKLFEYWAHEASFVPIEDFPLYRHAMLRRHYNSADSRYEQSWNISHLGQLETMLTVVRERGRVRSADFVRTDGQTGAWWNWKDEKRALEILFNSGELMIARRQNFQRVYDLRERVLPDWDDARLPPIDEVGRELVLKAVHALGITTAGWVGDYFRTGKKATTPIVSALAAEGALLQVEVEGWREPAFVHPTHSDALRDVANGQHQSELTTLLSPFDPLVWDRERARIMFGFDYRIECYTPAPKRRYGYFTLPILRRGELVGRLDPKAHRKERRFEVKALHLEPGVQPSAELVTDVAGAIRECAVWNGTPDVDIRFSDPPEFGPLLLKTLA